MRRSENLQGVKRGTDDDDFACFISEAYGFRGFSRYGQGPIKNTNRTCNAYSKYVPGTRMAKYIGPWLRRYAPVHGDVIKVQYISFLSINVQYTYRYITYSTTGTPTYSSSRIARSVSLRFEVSLLVRTPRCYRAAGGRGLTTPHSCSSHNNIFILFEGISFSQ